MAFDLKQASSLVEIFDGNPEKTDTFVDSANLLIELTPATQTVTLFKFLKTRLAGQARQVLTPALNDNPQTLVQQIQQTCISRQTPETIIAKLKCVKQRGQTETFCEEIEKLTNKLNGLYVQQNIPANVASKMATKVGVDSLISGTNNPEIKLILKSATFNHIGEAIQKTMENSSNPPNSVLYFARNTYGSNNRGRNGNYRGRGRRGYHHGQTRFQNNYRNTNNNNNNNNNDYHRHNNRGRRGNFNGPNNHHNIRQVQAENGPENQQGPQRALQNALPLREARE